MKIVLATGIYPPDIGGPATYVHALAKELVAQGNDVSVITYGDQREGEKWSVISVSRSLPIVRWFLYAYALKKHASDAEVVIAFSSVSCGLPLWISRLQKPKKILRLGGDFFWERYTDRGGMKSLRDWYASGPTSKKFMSWLLHKFDHIVFSTRFQEEIYEQNYKNLPSHSVIENAVPFGSPIKHERHEPFRLLFMGRFVGFKNLPALLKALGGFPFSKDSDSKKNEVICTLVGDGPMKSSLLSLSQSLGLENTVVFLHPVHGEKKQKIFAMHDILIIPSITEISPNVALEARAAGLPVLLTSETGLSEKLTQGMILRDLSTPEKISAAIQEVVGNHSAIAEEAAKEPAQRGWGDLAEEWRAAL